MSEPVQEQASSQRETLAEDLYSSGVRVTRIGMAVNILLVVIKLVGGILGRSAAMVADALHSLSDLATDFGALIGLRYITKPADTDHAYGHGRVETAISLLMSIAIILTGIGILKSGAHTLLNAASGVLPVKPGVIALVMGFLSIVLKEILFRYTRREARKSGSKTLEANAWHHRSDAFSSVGTVIGVGGALILGDKWTVLDPIAAVFVGVLIIKVGFDMGLVSFRELSDESLSAGIRERIEQAICSVESVEGYHHVRTRALGRYVTVEAHILVLPSITVREGHRLAHVVEDAVRQALDNAAFVTIHVEPFEYRDGDGVATAESVGTDCRSGDA